MNCNVPILLCVFNRPDLTERVFAAIARQRPRHLLIAADGPRPELPGDDQLVRQTRQIASRVDWPCQLLTRFEESNIGCRHQMARAISWALDVHEQVIVLEDDCLPDPTFFGFCESLLHRFACNPRIMMISGDNFQSQPRSAFSYYFSKYAHIWGWATWRRAWQHFDLEMREWPRQKQAGLINRWCGDAEERAYWTSIFDRQHASEIDTWDYSWAFACWARSGLTVLPETNLVSNIGFRADGTHTIDASSRLANQPVQGISKLRHPPVIARDLRADNDTWRNVFAPPSPADKEPPQRVA